MNKSSMIWINQSTKGIALFLWLTYPRTYWAWQQQTKSVSKWHILEAQNFSLPKETTATHTHTHTHTVSCTGHIARRDSTNAKLRIAKLRNWWNESKFVKNCEYIQYIVCVVVAVLLAESVDISYIMFFFALMISGFICLFVRSDCTNFCDSGSPKCLVSCIRQSPVERTTSKWCDY